MPFYCSEEYSRLERIESALAATAQGIPAFFPDLTGPQAGVLLARLVSMQEALRAAGMPLGDARIVAHADADNLLVRRSAVCPYENLRAALIISWLAAERQRDFGDSVAFAAVPRGHRLASHELKDYGAEKTLVIWNRAYSRLNRADYRVKGMASLRFDKLIDSDGGIDYQPVLRGVIWGASAYAVRQAFHPTRLEFAEEEDTQLHLRCLTNIDEIGDMLVPLAARLVDSTEGPLEAAPLGWAGLPAESGPDWLRFMSSYRMDDLLRISHGGGFILRSSSRGQLRVPTAGPADIVPLFFSRITPPLDGSGRAVTVEHGA